MAERMTAETSLPFPLRGAVVLMVFALLAAAFAARTDIGVTRLEPVTAGESKDLMMVARPDGSVLVTDLTQPARSWAALPANGEGFVQVVVQALERARGAAGVDPQRPYRLLRQPDGRLWLLDLSTQQQLALDAFGPVSARAFEKFLDDGKVHP